MVEDCVLEPAMTGDWRGVECRNNMWRFVLACRVISTFVGKEQWEGAWETAFIGKEMLTQKACE